MKLNLPYVAFFRSKSGRQHAYYRRDGARTAIKSPDGRPLLPGQPGFLDAYAAIHACHGGKTLQDRPSTADRSVKALVASYLASDEFSEKAPATQKQYGRFMNEIVAKIGGKSAVAIEMPHVVALRDAFGGRATPRKANLAVAMLSILMEHARGLGWRKDNPALRPKRLATGPGFPTWTEEEFEALMSSDLVGEPLKRAVAVAYFTGLRVGDLVKIPRSARQGGVIALVTGKTGAGVHIPEHPRLTAVLDAAPPTISPTLLTRADGTTWPLNYLQNMMTKAVRDLGLRKGLSFHGLRKGLTAALAESEATDAEIEAVIPHADPAMTRHYRKHANQKRMAASAMAKLQRRGA